MNRRVYELSASMREVIDKKMYVPGSYTDTLLKKGLDERGQIKSFASYP